MDGGEMIYRKWAGMSFFTIEDFLILDEGSEVLKKQFENHCN